MKNLLFSLMLFFSVAKAQDQPVKWATQETFFEDLAGKKLPDFNGRTVNQKHFSNADLVNQVVVINFWFEKCPPCIAEMPELNLLREKYNGKNIRFIGITHDKPLAAKHFQKRSGYQYEIVSLTMDEIRKLNINHGFPSNIIVGADGKIVYATANISFVNPEFKDKSIKFEEALKATIAKADSMPN